MKNILNLFLGLIFLWQSNNFSIAQSNATYSIKEQYDKRQNTFIENGSYNPCNVGSVPKDISDLYGDGMSYVLESYIRMYETTKDKAYLIKFILDAICMHEHRRDVLGIDSDPTWGCKSCCNGQICMYHDGLIIWPMSHFVHQVIIEEPSLYSLPLPQITNTKITNNLFGATFNTYGDFAQWLRIRTEQTLDWYTYGNSGNGFANYWGDDTRCYIPTTDHTDRALVINMQAGFASALFYLGITDPNTDYLHKAVQIAKAYKGTYIEKHPDIFNLCLFPSSHTYPVMDLQSNNSYVWKTNGWREITCNDYKEGKNDYEDISHAIQGLIYPRAIHNRLESNSVVLFDDNDMTRFRNTFSFNIYAGNSSGCPHFHSGIDGDDIVNYNSGFNGLDALKIRALSWMPFYKYDSYSSAPDVYDIVMSYYVCDILNNINNIESGMDFYGLSEVVAAQWDKECVNLTLYSRDVIYNQDFVVKNKLVVAPQQNDNVHQIGEDPFAEPKTFVDNGSKDRFVVEAGVTVNMVAGESIELLPGFETRLGSDFSASINLSTCTDGMRAANLRRSNTLNNVMIKHEIYNVSLTENIDKRFGEITVVENKLNLSDHIVLYPNPNSGQFQIEFLDTDLKSAEIIVYDATGKIVCKQNNIAQNSVQVELCSLQKGIYLVQVLHNGNSYTKRIVLQ